MLIGCGIDWYEVAIKGSLSSDVETTLTARLAEARRVASDVEVILGETVFRLARSSRPGAWNLENGSFRVRVEPEALGGFGLVLRATNVFLGQTDPALLPAICERVAALFVPHPDEIRMRRIDLRADFTEFSIVGIPKYAWVTHAGVTDHGDNRISSHARNGIDTGFTFGRSAIVGRVYAKTLEMRQKGQWEDEKNVSLRKAWEGQGWNGTDPVTRVECQIRGTALDELGIRKPEVCVKKIDSLWGYFVRSPWLRLILPDTASRRTRCKTDPRWLQVEQAVFQTRLNACLTRERRRGAPTAKQVFGILSNFSARHECAFLSEITRELVDKWSGKKAAWFLRDWMDRDAQRAAREAASEKIRLLGPHNALIGYAERHRSTLARIAPADGIAYDINERTAIGA
jgi:hypothetical protein